MFTCADCRCEYGTDHSEAIPRPVVIWPKWDDSGVLEPWIIEGDTYGWHENDGICFMCYSYAMFGGDLDPQVTDSRGVYPEVYTINPALLLRNRQGKS